MSNLIPQFNQSNVLPPFQFGAQPIDIANVSPYKTTFNEFVLRFSSNEKRINILHGYIDYCKKLESIGIIEGIQWVDGSFTENVELSRNRPPNDIDLVTLIVPPFGNNWRNIFEQNRTWLTSPGSKADYFCDAYIIDLSANPQMIVRNTCYWFGLFTHQRDTYIWKGILQLDLKEVLESINNGIAIGGQNA